MNQNGSPDSGALHGDGLADAVSVARRLLGELAGTLEARGDLADAAALEEGRVALARLGAQNHITSSMPPKAADGAALILDVSDLIGYFATNRLPTGIQRVQAELIFNILKTQSATALCCFVEARDQWVEVNKALFMDICARSRTGSDPLEPQWMAMIRTLQSQVNSAPAYVFRPGTVLANVGTSWWLPNYFLYVRQAKIAAGIRYVPLVYDLIPILMPQNCDPELVQEFIGWFIGVLETADFFLVISEATKRDLIAIAERIGRPVSQDRIATIALDADFRRSVAVPTPRRFHEPFVLFVSTIEARKNQLGALDAWGALIARHGMARVPRLVLVGKRGFQGDRVLARLETNADLRERVTILSGIGDDELQALYRDCSFTIYPSVYEGWGLPVTEALSYGKVALIADNSSLPEAGGTNALYFPTGSTGAMITALEQVILEPGYRERQERVIRERFRPRDWTIIAQEMYDHITKWATATELTIWQPPVVQHGAYYPVVRNRSARIWRGMGSAEAFRSGYGWSRLENDSCRTRQTGAELTMRLARRGAARLGLEIAGPSDAEAHYDVTIPGHETALSGRIRNGQKKWVFLDIPDTVGDMPFSIRFETRLLTTPHLHDKGSDLGIALSGFFLFGDEARAGINFLEAVAFGALADLDYYRDRIPAAG